MKQWQYKRLTVPRGSQPDSEEEFDEVLEGLGEEGWELVAVDDGTAYLKRERGTRIPRPDRGDQ